MKILLKGYYGFGNFGDDLLMLISYNLLKEKFPEASIAVFSNHTVNLKEYRQKPNYNQYIYKILGEKVNLVDWTHRGHFDLLVEGGGGTYFDESQNQWLYLLRNTIVNLLNTNILRKIDHGLRLVLNKPKQITYHKRVALGIGIGPFSKTSKTYYDNIVELASIDKLIVRDIMSYRLAFQLRKNQNLTLGSDLAFLTKYWGTTLNDPLNKSTQKTIGFVLKGNKTEFENNIQRVAKLFLKEGWSVRFFAFDKNIDGEFIDACEKYYHVASWCPETITIAEYIQKLQECTILATERAHGAIVGAIIGCVPFFLQKTYKMNQILSFFENTTSTYHMLFNKKIMPKEISNMYNEISDRKACLQLDCQVNYNKATEGVYFAFEQKK